MAMAMKRQRRLGSTSPPLVGVEPNPGPRKRGRKVARDERPAKRTKKLEPEEDGQIMAYLNLKMSPEEIAKLVGCSPKTVRNKRDRFIATGSMQRKKGSGRPQKLTDREQRNICTQSRRDNFTTAVQIHRSLMGLDGKARCSVRTVRNVLIKNNLNGRVAAQKPYLSQAHKQRRLEWAKAHKHWTNEQWRRVVFSDETSVHLIQRGGKRYVRRRPGERFRPSCVIPTVKHGGGKVNVWSCFHAGGVGPVKHIDGIMDRKIYHGILTTHAVPFMKSCIENDQKEGKEETKETKEEKREDKEEKKAVCWVFQQDNDPKHTAKMNEKYLERKSTELNFTLMNWPSQSPDLSPIENLWHIVKLRLQQRPRFPTSEASLVDAIKEEWRAIPPQTLQKLADSMRLRCVKVIAARGGSIKY